MDNNQQELIILEAHRSINGSWFCGTEEIAFKEKIVVFIQAYTPIGLPYVIVPGYKTSERYITKTASAMKVSPIFSPEEQKQIEAILEPLTRGNIYFWR